MQRGNPDSVAAKEIKDIEKRIETLRSCASIQFGSHLDTLPVVEPPPINTNPVIAVEGRPIQREIGALLKFLLELKAAADIKEKLAKAQMPRSARTRPFAGLTPELLGEVGEILFGNKWQLDLAKSLGVSDRTIRRWVTGASAMPPELVSHLMTVAYARAAEITEVAKHLAQREAAASFGWTSPEFGHV